MITVDSDTRSWIEGATDMSVVAEIYDPDEVPPFDPANALKLYASTDDVTFAGETYTPLVKNFGTLTRTITPEVNTASLELDNLTREASRFEFDTGFEGCIVVYRWISRSKSTSLSKSIILWAGRLKAPTTGSRTSLPLEAKFIVGSVDVQIPRRKYAFDDPEGRPHTDPLFEGFRFMPQYGTTTYSVRVRRGGLLGLLGFKKRVTQTLQYSSYSDLDQEQYVPDVFGRAQVGGTHLGYADAGTEIKMTTAFCEGEIEAFQNFRSTDNRYFLSGTPSYRYGKAGNVGTQVPYTDATWPSNGYYSKTAVVFSKVGGTNIENIDPAPDMVAVILGKKVTTPTSGGTWNVTSWSDNGAAVMRHLLTNSDYFKLTSAWVDDASFKDVYDYNDEIIFDYSFTDVLFIPNTTSFVDGGTYQQTQYSSTGAVGTSYFKYLNGDATASAAFLLAPRSIEYDDTQNLTSLVPPPPDDGPFPGGGSTSSSSYLSYYLRRRYTCNVVVSEEMALLDFINDVVMPSSRMFMAMNSDGKVALKTKKPVDHGYLTASASAAGTSLSLDDVSAWVGDTSQQILIDPSTTVSEISTVSSATYPSSQNSVTLTSSAKITVTSFSGASGGSTPATATIEPNDLDVDHLYTFTLEGTEIKFNIGAGDTLVTIAGFIYGSINAHPVLSRRFKASWTPGTDTVTVTAKFGTLNLASGLINAHSGPLSNPTTAPTLTATASGSLPAGTYRVCYSFQNAKGQTLTSPTTSVTLTANQKITVSTVTPPTGATVNWYVSPAAASSRLRLLANNDGSSFVIDSLPRLNDQIPPDFNRTGTEVVRVAAVFSDRAEVRSGNTASNVLKASYSWKLGNREKPVNRIDLKYRDASQDFRLITLRLSDADHIAKTKQVNAEEVNGTAIDNYHQAYRIAAGLLAEKRDADFFYQWKSDRLAGLLQEGDVVCITDDGSEVYNLLVRIESIETTVEDGFPVFSFIARKYASTLYDDSVADRTIPIVVEAAQGNNYV